MVLTLAVLMAAATCQAATDAPTAPISEGANKMATPRTHPMKIRIKTGEAEITATMQDNAAARDFISLLPLTLTLQDYASTEKISDLPKKLSSDGAPAGIEPRVGDITFYAPWGNLAIFYKDFRYSSGLVKLGQIDSGIEHLQKAGSIKVTIERAGKQGR